MFVIVGGGVLENVWVSHILKSEGYEVCRNSAGQRKNTRVIYARGPEQCEIYKEKFCEKTPEGKYRACLFDREHELIKTPTLSDLLD